MRFLRLIIFCLLAGFVFNGCIKKADEDPLVSIYKRSTRLTGVWLLKELQIQDYDKDASGKLSIVIRTLYKDKYTETRGTDTISKTFYGTIKATLTILAKNTYNYSEDVSTNGLNYHNEIKEKNWAWNDDHKKTGLILSEFKSFDITGLHSEELVLTITDINNLNANNSHSYVERWVFKKQ